MIPRQNLGNFFWFEKGRNVASKNIEILTETFTLVVDRAPGTNFPPAYQLELKHGGGVLVKYAVGDKEGARQIALVLTKTLEVVGKALLDAMETAALADAPLLDGSPEVPTESETAVRQVMETLATEVLDKPELATEILDS